MIAGSAFLTLFLLSITPWGSLFARIRGYSSDIGQDVGALTIVSHDQTKLSLSIAVGGMTNILRLRFLELTGPATVYLSPHWKLTEVSGMLLSSIAQGDHEDLKSYSLKRPVCPSFPCPPPSLHFSSPVPPTSLSVTHVGALPLLLQYQGIDTETYAVARETKVVAGEVGLPLP